MFGTALASDLKAFLANQHSCMLLQYADDLLLTRNTYEECMERKHLLLNFLLEAGYEVSKRKAQIFQEIPRLPPVPGQNQLSPERKQTVYSIPVPTIQ